MKLYLLTITLCVGLVNFTNAQTTLNGNTSSRILTGDEGLHIGGYAQIDFNQEIFNDNIFNNSKLDVHRLVTFFGYNFNENTSFVAEVEIEHVVEVYVEQAFLSHKLNDKFNLNAGLMLIPMGIQNLYHEPPTFNGVERTNVDKYIVPTTWREIGVGVSGRLKSYSINYELMAINGFSGYSDEQGSFGGSNGLRSGRQKGVESYMNKPDFAARINYYGEPGLSLGISAYIGCSESEEYNNLDLNNNFDLASADSTIVGIEMLGIDARYNKGPLQLRGQYIVANISNTEQYNIKSNSDLGKKLSGYYAEVGYDLLNKKNTNEELIGFFRYENYDTHSDVDVVTFKNDAYNRTEMTFGLGWKVAKGAMLKFDYQILSNASETSNKSEKLNFGTAIWF